MGTEKKKKRKEWIPKNIFSCQRIYEQDVYARSCIARVTLEKIDGADLILYFDRTVFFPGGGGQSCDIGTVKALSEKPDRITAVREVLIDKTISVGKAYVLTDGIPNAYDGNVYRVIEGVKQIAHRVHGAAVHAERYRPGTEVFLDIDWDRRFENMQRHCGEHILSGAFYALFGAANKGFHMGEDYMTVDISLKGEDIHTPALGRASEAAKRAGGMISYEMAMEAELWANKVIWDNTGVMVEHFDTAEKASALPLRKPLDIKEDITVVTIGDPKTPKDCVACCGTHPATAGQVGLIKVYKVEPNKGMTRVYFDAGSKALANYRNRHDILGSIENRLSAGDSDVTEKFEAELAKAGSLRDELYRTRQRLYRNEADKILDMLDLSGGEILLSRRYEDLSNDDILGIGKTLTSELKRSNISWSGAFALISEQSMTVFIYSEGFDAGRAVRELAPEFGGTGGGSPAAARVTFPDKRSMDAFVSRLSDVK